MQDVEFALKRNTKYRGWLYLPEYHATVYMRVCSKYIHNCFQNTIDIANVAIDEHYRNRGHFKAFLKFIEELATTHGRIVYVESIINPLVKSYLTKCGYERCMVNESSMFKNC